MLPQFDKSTHRCCRVTLWGCGFAELVSPVWTHDNTPKEDTQSTNALLESEITNRSFVPVVFFLCMVCLCSALSRMQSIPFPQMQVWLDVCGQPSSLLIVLTVHTWDFSSGSALLPSCPLRRSLHFLLKRPLDADRDRKPHKGLASSPDGGVWYCIGFLLNGCVTVTSEVGGATQSGVYFFSHADAYLCVHVCSCLLCCF